MSKVESKPPSCPDDASENMPEPLLVVQRRLIIVVLSLLALLLFSQFVSFFADILRILGISVLISYLFIGVVDWLERYLPNRALSIFCVYLISTILIVLGLVLVLPSMVYQVSQLVDTTFNQLPQLIQYVIHALAPLEEKFHAAQIQVRAVDIITNFAANIPKPDPTQILSKMSDVAMSTMTWVLYALSIFVVSFYFLLDGHRIKEAIIGHCPVKHQPFLRLIARDTDTTLQTFFRGQIVLGGVFGAFMMLVFFLLGVHYALLLGVFLGIWEIVPVVGSLIGFLPAVISVAIHGMDTVHLNRAWQLIILFVIFNGFQWIKDNTVAPRYIGNVIGLHPVMVFIAIMIGARIDGMLGIIFSLPAACVVNVLVTRLYGSRSKTLETASTTSVAATKIQTSSDQISEATNEK